MRRHGWALLPSIDSARHGVASRWLHVGIACAMVLAAIRICWADARTPLKPGWNLFTPEQDIQIGKQASAKIGQQVLLLNDPRVDNYLDALGKKLAGYAPGYKYPYQYRGVNDENINAFALPGGFVYIDRGAIEAADNEAQLAGVMAHETSHVALRHGTTSEPGQPDRAGGRGGREAGRARAELPNRFR